MIANIPPRHRNLRRWSKLTVNPSRLMDQPMRENARRALSLLFTVFLLAFATTGGAAAEWKFPAASRTVVIGDVHGAFSELSGLLRQTGLVDGELRWIGGQTQLVSVGDLLDRGDDSRKVMDLLMRLQQEATSAGGSVYVILGNHEVMNLTGDLRYVSPGEYAAYQDMEPAEVRADARTAFLADAAAQGLAGDAAEQAFIEQFPPGYFGHRAAFSEGGAYGQWLRAMPTMILVGDTLFVHGGLPPSLLESDIPTINADITRTIADYSRVWGNVAARFKVPVSQRGRVDALRALGDEEATAAATQLESLLEAPVLGPVGPLWIRETALCHPLTQTDTVRAILDRVGASRVVFGHTPTETRRVTSRMGAMVIMADTGMLRSYYEGMPAALIIERESLSVLYAGGTSAEPVDEEIRRIGKRPGNLSDDELEDFLANADIVATEEVGTGVTKPLRVTLERDGMQVRALYKGVSTPITGGGPRRRQLIEKSDRFEHEVAAYKLDRLLDLDLVPVTVERSVNGNPGALQFWVEGMISLLEKNEQGITADGYCPINPQYNLMYIFDSLILNTDRTQQNVTFTRDDWMITLIDHSRAFRLSRKLPQEFRNFPISVGDEMARRLERLDQETLNAELGAYIDRDQIRSLLGRRDDLLKNYRE